MVEVERGPSRRGADDPYAGLVDVDASSCYDLLVSLHNVAQDLPASLDLDEVLDSTIARLRQLIDLDSAAILLREKVGPRRWAATAIGFGGALIILRPGIIEVSPAAVLAHPTGGAGRLEFFSYQKVVLVDPRSGGSLQKVATIIERHRSKDYLIESRVCLKNPRKGAAPAGPGQGRSVLSRAREADT